MTYEVEITDQAVAELEEAFEWIHQRSPTDAERWRLRLLERAQTLEQFPRRCPLAPENEYAEEEVRQLLCGNYRLLFTVSAHTVYVLHVRHAARRPLGRGELAAGDFDPVEPV